MSDTGFIDPGPPDSATPTGTDQRTLARTQKLLKAGHQWLPPQTLFALADSKSNDFDMVKTAESIRQAQVKGFKARGIKPDDGFKFFTADPLLQKRTSAALALKQYLTGAIGAWPVQDEHLNHIQAQLQRQGFGKELPADGAWNPAWDAAWRQWGNTLRTAQLAGNKPGGLTVGHALHLMGAVLPKAAGNAIVGYVKAMPGQARDLTAQLAQGAAAVGLDVANIPGYITDPGDTRKKVLAASAGVGARVQSALGKDQSVEQYQKESQSLGRLVQNVGNMLLVHSALKAGAQLSLAVGENLVGGEAGKELGLAAAQRGPGVIADSFGRAANSNAIANIPGLGRLGPIVGKLADADGLYYKARTLVAAPYKIAGVRIAGDVATQGGLLGAKIRAVAAASGVDGPTDLSKAVQGERTLNTFEDAINHRLDQTPLGKYIQPNLDDLAFFFHGPVHGRNTLSAHVGDNVDGVVAAATEAMGRVGLNGQIERGVGIPIAKQIKQLGGEENWVKFWTNKSYEHASAWWASAQMHDPEVIAARAEKLGEPGMPLTSLQRADLHRDLTSIARNDPAIHTKALRDLLAQGAGSEELARRISNDITNSRLSPTAYLSKGAVPYMDASKVMADVVIPEMKRAKGLITTPGEDAKLGIARKETLTQQSAYRKIANIAAEFRDFTARAADGLDLATVEQGQSIDAKLNAMLFEDFGVDGLRMPHDIGGKLERANEFARRLAADVYPAADESPALAAARAKIDSHGYKIVTGTDIGWMHVPNTPLDLMEGPLTFRRKVVEHLGVNPEIHTNQSIGAARRDGIRNSIADAVEAGRVTLPAYWTPDTVLAYLKQEGIVDAEPGRLKGAVMALSGTPNKRAIADYLAAHPDLSRAEAMTRAREELTKAMQPRDIPRKRFVEAFTNPDKFAGAAPESALAAELATGEEHLPGSLPGFSKDHAEALYRAVVKGSATPKSYMLGLSRIDDLFRASMGFAGEGRAQRAAAGAIIGGVVGTGVSAAHGDFDLGDIAKGAAAGGAAGGFGGDRLGWAMANLPNKLVQTRNEVRFTLSPYFDFRRVAKTNAKLGLEGVEWTATPLRRMEKAGTLEHDKEVLRRVYPELNNEIADDADRYLRANSVFGFYNHRNYEAYAAGAWARMGKTDEEIRGLITKVFSYGNRTVEGRSALERSTNFLFFPFSFDKTLYRNFGGYLLDRPAQQILLTRGLASYHDFNEAHKDDPGGIAGWLSSKGLERHIPVLQEAERLNAFAHGISAGEPGGINRPLINMFLPQAWAPSAANRSTLDKFVPAFRDIGRAIEEGRDQGSILQATGQDMYRKLKGIPSTPGNPRPTAESHDSQMERAFAMQREWFDSYKTYLDHNAGTRDPAEKVRFPLSAEWGKWAGEPITKANVRDIIAKKYPAYDPEKAATLAIVGNAKLKAYIDSTKGTDRHDYVVKFTELAGHVGRALASDKYSAAEAADVTTKLRAAASWLARHDAKFYRLYNSSYRRWFGPLEEVTNG